MKGTSNERDIQKRQLRHRRERGIWSPRAGLRHDVEVKVSRSDWLTELKDPEKAETFKRYCNRWWLAVSDASIVREDLPAGWGLLVLQPNGVLRAAKQAPRLDAVPMPLPIVIGFARAVQKTSSRHLAPSTTGEMP